MDARPGSLDQVAPALMLAALVLTDVSVGSLEHFDEQVSPSQFRALAVLAALGPSRLVLLAERLGVGPSSALRSVDRLVGLGHVARRSSTEDRREVVLEATPAGSRLVEQVTGIRRTAMGTLLARMPETERAALVPALEAFTRAFADSLTPDAATTLGW